MTQKISFAGGFAMGFAALAIAVSSSSSAWAQKTWTGSGTNRNWTTAANWSSSGAPTTGQSVTFAGASQGAVNLPGAGTARLGNVTISSGTYEFNGGAMVLGAVSLTNNGTVSIANLSVGPGNTASLLGTGVTTITNITGGGNISVRGDVVWQGGVTDFATGIQVDENGSLTVTGNYFNDTRGLAVNGGVLKGNGVDPFSTSTDGFDMNLGVPGGTAPSVVLSVFDVATFDKVISNNGVTDADVSFAGNLDIDVAPLAGALPNNSSLRLFTFDPLQKNGSFASVNLTGASGGPYDGLSFVDQGGGIWQTGDAGGQYLVFNENTGYLVVVPEPSTIAFAGIGIGMAGWSAWKKRRLAKVLAKK